MTDTDRAAIRARAAHRAIAMGLATRPAEPDDTDVVDLPPAASYRVLQELLRRGHLTPRQAAAARRRIADAQAIAATEETDQ